MSVPSLALQKGAAPLNGACLFHCGCSRADSWLVSAACLMGSAPEHDRGMLPMSIVQHGYLVHRMQAFFAVKPALS